MNKVILMGRLTREPDVRYSTTGAEQLAIARYTLAIDRRYQKDSQNNADFIRCVTFGKSAEFAEKYFHQGTKIVVEGRIQTGSYQDKDGKTVYTVEVVAENQEFAESKQAAQNNNVSMAKENGATNGMDDFVSIPEGADESGLPFNF
ncbi:MAG: single-stranded DNA-binding protein [Eubacterium ventriosum]|jgi:single-strand DNA-binding protein|uniref:single-stranded DNA-binding protein n=1 Tax=Eubacterium ventriosum TaxID=39496 RepID=UPI001DEC72F3|nr:single-stranded DNA-binding protein [Eubacterium ventriosum]MBD9054529.1 single-stranded DNA-binding protein [Eubacterium ventriosum]